MGGWPEVGRKHYVFVTTFPDKNKIFRQSESCFQIFWPIQQLRESFRFVQHDRGELHLFVFLPEPISPVKSRIFRPIGRFLSDSLANTTTDPFIFFNSMCEEKSSIVYYFVRTDPRQISTWFLGQSESTFRYTDQLKHRAAGTFSLFYSI